MKQLLSGFCKILKVICQSFMVICLISLPFQMVLIRDAKVPWWALVIPILVLAAIFWGLCRMLDFAIEKLNPAAALKADAGSAQKRSEPTRKISEIKATCQACGHIYFFDKTDQLTHMGAEMEKTGQAMMCCGGCWPMAFAPQKQTVDPSRCPKCGSRAVQKEKIVHEI